MDMNREEMGIIRDALLTHVRRPGYTTEKELNKEIAVLKKVINKIETFDKDYNELLRRLHPPD